MAVTNLSIPALETNSCCEPVCSITPSRLPHNILCRQLTANVPVKGATDLTGIFVYVILFTKNVLKRKYKKCGMLSLLKQVSRKKSIGYINSFQILYTFSSLNFHCCNIWNRGFRTETSQRLDLLKFCSFYFLFTVFPFVNRILMKNYGSVMM